MNRRFSITNFVVYGLSALCALTTGCERHEKVHRHEVIIEHDRGPHRREVIIEKRERHEEHHEEFHHER